MANLGYIQLNRTCNQQCLFCSNPENGNVLSYSKARFYIDDFMKNRVDGIIFTGGEPTLNKNLIRLIRYCKQKNLESRIITNGQLTADYDFMRELKLSGLNLIHVSIHSVKPPIQNYLSQNSNSFRNIIGTLQNARKLGVEVNINTVINRFNAKNLHENMRFFIVKFPEIKHFVFNNLDPKMNRVEKNTTLIPRLGDFKDSLLKALTLLSKNGKTFRVERVPLCYMTEFAEYSTETRKIIKNEERRILFLDDRPDNYSKQDYFFYEKAKQCKKCSLNEICAGLYAMDTHFSSKELEPQAINKNIIIKRILNG